MISSIHIKNFKSIVDLTLELGRINVFIGENGCGKTNILEAIAFGAAASADKLDFEFLGSRGIRLTKPEFMYSAFEAKSSEVILSCIAKDDQWTYILKDEKSDPNSWTDLYLTTFNTYQANIFDKIFNNQKPQEDYIFNTIRRHLSNKDTLVKLHKYLYNGDKDSVLDEEFYNKILPELNFKRKPLNQLSGFIIYSPEESLLREFKHTSQIYPLGIKGEGLFQYLKELSQSKEKTILLKKIKENLSLLDWFDDFSLPKNLMSNEYALQIGDKYLHKDLRYFDQKSTNEGFLYLLFYFTLFCSDITPKFFAIDNIDSSLNPKLCSKLTSTLTKLAKENDKQALLTTHNPAILDGLDLRDDEQRLFVVSRNIDGHTRVRRILHKPERTKALSEIWTGGFIGGLPDNF